MLVRHHDHYDYRVLIKLRVQERSFTSVGRNWLAAQRAVLTLGKTAICIFVAKFYGRMPDTFGSPRAPPVLTWAVCSSFGTMN